MCYNRLGITHVHADVAQLVEQLSCKQQVIGSSPIVGFQTDDSPSKVGLDRYQL